MPKEGRRREMVLNSYVRTFPSEFSTDGNTLWCVICNKTVNASKKYNIDQHRRAASHMSKKDFKIIKVESLNSCHLQSEAQTTFDLDLCQTLIQAGIPLVKLDHPALREFLYKYTGQQIPVSLTLQEKCIPSLYTDTVKKIRAEFADQKIWISIVESVDSMKRNVANVIFGVLDNDVPYKPRLVSVKVWDEVDNAQVLQTVMDSLQIVYPNGILYNNVLLFVTDVAPYMVAAGKLLQKIFPRALHLTCMARVFHGVCDEIRVTFPNVDRLITLGKKVFNNCSSNLRALQAHEPFLPLPPVYTKRGAWIEAAMYYAQNFHKIKWVIEQLDDGDENMRDAKEIFNIEEVANQLDYIQVHYSFLVQTIRNLEQSNANLESSVQAIEDADNKIKNAANEGEMIYEKLAAILEENSGFKQIKVISKIIQGNSPDLTVKNVSADEIGLFKFAPLTACNVETSFPHYKELLKEDQEELGSDLFEKHAIICCNNI